MARGQTVRLVGDIQRRVAHNLIDRAPAGAIVNIREASRSTEQNAKMWAMLSDVSRSKPDGRKATPEVWKCLFMQALNHAVRFEIGLDGAPFPTGFSSSALNKQQMSDLIEFIYEYGARHDVRWTEPVRGDDDI